MKKFTEWLINFLCGTIFCYGKAVVLWIIIYAIFKKPEINFKNALFLLTVCIIPWAINFIFHFNSSVVVKGILHGVIWFILVNIIFTMQYNYAVGAFVLILYIVIFGLVYGVSLFVISSLSQKLNTPFRHICDFISKYKHYLVNKIK